MQQGTIQYMHMYYVHVQLVINNCKNSSCLPSTTCRYGQNWMKIESTFMYMYICVFVYTLYIMLKSSILDDSCTLSGLMITSGKCPDKP